MPKTTTYANALLNVRRGTAFGFPSPLFAALLTCTKGQRANSTAYSLTDTIVLTPSGASKLKLYKCTTAGTTAAAQSTLYPGVANEVITDGTAVFTEQTSALQAGTAQVEPSTGAYARVSVTDNTTNWAAAASGAIATGAAVTWPTATAAWTTGSAAAWAVGWYDASTAGNCWEWDEMSTAVQVSSGATPSAASGAITASET